MTKRLMYGPLLKVERADYHIRELEAILSRYIRSNVKAMRGKFNRNTREYVRNGFITALPVHTPTLIGDAVHNLRVSLDHAYWILVRENGGEFDRRVKFPFFDTREQVISTLNGHPKTILPKQHIIDFIVSDMQPFIGGQHSLYNLHRLDITDKHQLLLPTSKMFTVGPHTLTIGEQVFRGATKEASFITDNIDSPIFITKGPIKYTGNMQEAITVLFGPGEMNNRPVLDTLRTLSQNIRSSIIELEGHA